MWHQAFVSTAVLLHRQNVKYHKILEPSFSIFSFFVPLEDVALHYHHAYSCLS